MIKEALQSYKEMWLQIFCLKGRISRKKFWLALGIHIDIFAILYVSSFMLQSLSLEIFSYVFFLACCPMGVRRMHDVGKSGWFQFIPLVGLFYELQPSQPFENQYGKPESK